LERIDLEIYEFSKEELAIFSRMVKDKG